MPLDLCPRGRGPLPAALALALALGAAAVPPAAAGTFSVVTYNVAGLPEGISGSNPSVNMPLISPLLNDFDLAVVQEDFYYHKELISQLEHPYLTPPIPPPLPVLVGDGLHAFSQFPFSDFTRVPWDDCFGRFDFGSDCLAHKGFTMARHELEPGAFLDVYNWHADAGGDEGSNAARRSNLRQLAEWIVTFSADQAVLVLGDSNSRYADEDDIVPELIASAGLTDLWVDFIRGGDAPETGPRVDSGCATAPAGPECEQIDKILYRSSDQLLLSPLAYDVPIERFTRVDGEDLSDHPPVSAVFAFQVVPEPRSHLLLALALAALGARRRRRA